MPRKKYDQKKGKKKRVVQRGRIYVTATFNNTIVSITDTKGDVIAWSSTGASGFKGSRKSTSYAATITAENAVNQAKNYGLREAEVYIKGPGPGRSVILRVLRSKGIKMSLIADMTPMPHNGTRPRKSRN